MNANSWADRLAAAVERFDERCNQIGDELMPTLAAGLKIALAVWVGLYIFSHSPF